MSEFDIIGYGSFVVTSPWQQLNSAHKTDLSGDILPSLKRA
jgi:hypothetical protein